MLYPRPALAVPVISTLSTTEALKMRDRKMQDWKMPDLENAGFTAVIK